MKNVLPKINIAFAHGFFVVSRQDDEENPVGHERASTWMFPFVIWLMLMGQFLSLKHKKPWDKANPTN